MSAVPASRCARAAPALTIALAVAFAVHRIEDFDVWYHLAAGRLMTETWQWPRANMFAFTAPAHPWINLHWVFQLLLHGAYRLGGANGCIALAATLVAATAGALYLLARTWLPPVAAALLLAVALVIASPRFVPRPELVSFLLFAVYLGVLEGHPANGRAIYALVPLQVLWTNSQGIFAIGLALIGCYWVGATLAFLPLPRGWKEESALSGPAWGRLTLVLVLAVAACLLNPYGLTGARFPLELLPRVTGASLFSTRIGEFRGPFESGYALPLAYTWAVLMAAAGLAFLANVRRLHLGRLLAALAFAWLSAQAIRNLAFFAWIAVPAIAANAGALLGRASHGRRGHEPIPSSAGMASRRRDMPPRRAGMPALVVRAAEGATLAAIALLAGAVVTNQLSRFLGTEREFGLGISPARFPAQAVAFAEEVGISGRGFNCLAMGGYLTWTRYPAAQVFVDGRLEAFPEAVFRQYFNVMDDPKRWPELARLYAVDYVLLYHAWPNRLPLVTYLAAGHGWTLVYYDEIASIFLPEDEAHRPMRERAAQAFAERLAQRAREPAPPVPSSLQRAIHVPVAETWRQRSYGSFLRSIGLYDEAIRAYERALALDPDEGEARFALGLSHWYAGNRPAAIREWRDLLRRDPGNERARRALAGAQGGGG